MRDAKSKQRQCSEDAQRSGRSRLILSRRMSAGSGCLLCLCSQHQAFHISVTRQQAPDSNTGDIPCQGDSLSGSAHNRQDISVHRTQASQTPTSTSPRSGPRTILLRGLLPGIRRRPLFPVSYFEEDGNATRARPCNCANSHRTSLYYHRHIPPRLPVRNCHNNVPLF